MSANNAKKWNIEQLKYIRFLAAGRKDTTGKVWTNEEYAKVLGVHPSTLSHWKADVLFRQAVMEETMGRFADFLPAMTHAQINKAIKKGDTPAFMAIMRQAGVIKADRIESKNENNGITGTVDLSSKDDKELDAFIAKYQGAAPA